MVAMTVEGPDKPRTVELVDPRTREWERIDREPSRGPLSAAPTLETITARDGLDVHRLAVPSTGGGRPDRGDDVPARWPRGSGQAGVQRVLPAAAGGGHHGLSAKCPRVRWIRPVVHACRRQGKALRGHRRRRRRGTVSRRSRSRARRPHRLLRLVLRRIPDSGGADVSSAAVRRGHQHLRNERPEHLVPQHRTVDRGGGLLEVRPSGQRPGTARPAVAFAARARADRTSAARTRLNDTNVPPSESQQMFEALRALGRTVELLVFEDDGHELDKRENRSVLVKAMCEWLIAAFAPGPMS